MPKDTVLKQQLLKLLGGRGAHVDFETAIEGVPAKYHGAMVEGAPYTLWELLEHIRMCQQDILEYIENPHYKERPWPEGYWPKTKKPPTKTAWKESVAAYLEDLRKVRRMIEDPHTDVFAELPYGEKGHIFLREVFLIADHTAYHLGQMVLLMRLLGAWNK